MYLREKGLWDWWACWAPDWPYWRCHCDSNAEPPSCPSVAPDRSFARAPFNAITEWQLAISGVKDQSFTPSCSHSLGQTAQVQNNKHSCSKQKHIAYSTFKDIMMGGKAKVAGSNLWCSLTQDWQIIHHPANLNTELMVLNPNHPTKQHLLGGFF